MIVATVQETRDRLEDFLAAVARGEVVVIADNGVWLATLGQPPAALHSIRSEQERVAKAEEFARAIAQWHAEDGLPYPPKLESPPTLKVESPAA